MLILKNYFIDFFNNKNKCRFKYIPEQLKTKKRPIVEKFEISELLFYRCDPQKLEKPYDNINLKDISHNRNFCDNNLYGHENVFFNIDASKPFEKYPNFSYITLEIKKLENSITYYRKINKTNSEGTEFIIEITLKHKPEVCMYPHSAFEIKLNSEEITATNYKKTIGKDNNFFSKLRGEIRQELTSLMQTGFIDDTNVIETINEP